MMMRQGQNTQLIGSSSFASARFAALFFRLILVALLFFCSRGSYGSELPSPTSPQLITEPDASHYAFANYLGSGIYRTSGQSAAVANIPLGFVLDSTDDYLLKLRFTASLGFFDYSFNDLPQGSIPKSVGTITLTPGLEYHWRVDDKLTLESYVDLGYGHNFSTSSHVGIFSTGISALYKLDAPLFTPVWVNRIYYAGYQSNQNDSTEGYSVFKSGIDFGVNYDWQWQDTRVEPRFFIAGHWYFDKLKFVSPVGDNVLTSYTYEIGTTLAFSKPITLSAIGLDGVEIEHFGLSYQVGGGLKVWRLIFEFPL
tara:strand:- start:12 stop:944 length:933 start_codon:yes stop_codon:yes gene_type:complete